MKVAKSLIERGIFSTEARKLMEKAFQLTKSEEDIQPIHENDEDVSEMVGQVSSDDKEDLDFDFIRVFTYNSDGKEVSEL